MQGARTGCRMPKHVEILDSSGSEAVRDYVSEQAWRAKRLQPNP